MPNTIPVLLVVWQCGCSQTGPLDATLPERCPGHDREWIVRPEQVNALPEHAEEHHCDEWRACDA